MSKTGRESHNTLKSTKSPSPIEIAWAAGFIEGEGGIMGRKDTQSIVVSQKNPQPIEWLLDIFGGNISFYGQRGGASDHYKWYVSGARARGIMFTIFPFMSNLKRSQIKNAFGSKEK